MFALGDLGDSVSVPRNRVWSERIANKSVDVPDGNASATPSGGIVVVHDAASASAAAQLPPWMVPPDDASAAENRHVECTLQKLRDMPVVAPILVPAVPGASQSSSSSSTNKAHNGPTQKPASDIPAIEYKPV